MTMPAFPKIFAIGCNHILDIFKDEVEITEKVDGSQFGFGKINGQLFLRSKGAVLYTENPTKMFEEGVKYIESIQDKLPDNIMFYGEYLKQPKHNVLSYGRIPKNHIMLFGACYPTNLAIHENLQDYTKVKTPFLLNYAEYTKEFDLESVPVLFRGKINDIKQLQELLNTESILGNNKIEGIVVKNYNRPFLLGGQLINLMCGKYVSEGFKEVRDKNWKTNHTGRGKLENFKLSFQTEARWMKAIQHLKEKDELEHSPKDIGKLLKEIHMDIEEEEKENIKEFLYKEFSGDIKRCATKGFPNWYKQKLLERAFES